MAYTQVKRTEIAHFLDITPSTTATWKVIGTGIVDYGQTYNANKTTEKWIINDVATTTIDSYSISGDVSQTCYFGDDVYDYVNELRRTEAVGDDAHTHILDIDKYDYTGSTYKAIQHDCVISITSYATGETPKIEYTIDYNGDGTKGTVTFSNGVPTFTADTVSL
jgi:hypothetical protein